jgi:hypothetical protein
MHMHEYGGLPHVVAERQAAGWSSQVGLSNGLSAEPGSAPRISENLHCDYHTILES